MTQLIVAFVHGYSVTNLDTYGEMPLRLKNEASKYGLEIKIENIFLGRYISFNDEVRLEDISRAMEQAVQQQIVAKNPGARFVCITHSTGGPVVRTWWKNYYMDEGKTCPMSHLVMLAPANHGSALAQLGKGRLSRVKCWFDGVEPGQRVLDWLELGSNDAWKLNKDWIDNGQSHIGPSGVFPFSIIGQSIDRKLYDHLNAYTGELGSDGVVRVAAANQNSTYIKLTQVKPVVQGGKIVAETLEVSEWKQAAKTAFKVVHGKSHSGDEMGIMKSVKRATSDTNSAETVGAIFRCFGVKTLDDYNKLEAAFAAETIQTQNDELVEKVPKLFKDRTFTHNRNSMIIFRVRDSEGYPVTDFDLILTGKDHNPNALPEGFFIDRQRNHLNVSNITYFLDYDVLNGRKEMTVNGVKLDKLPGITTLGIIIQPRPDDGFIRYLPCEIEASPELFKKIIQPNSTTMVDICLQRVVNAEVFQFEKLADDVTAPSKSFKDTKPGSKIIG